MRGAGTVGRLEGCDLWGNGRCGLWVGEGATAALAACAVRDHAGGGGEKGSGCGVYVDATAPGKATISADCVFARNAGNDVVLELGSGP